MKKKLIGIIFFCCIGLLSITAIEAVKDKDIIQKIIDDKDFTAEMMEEVYKTLSFPFYEKIRNNEAEKIALKAAKNLGFDFESIKDLEDLTKRKINDQYERSCRNEQYMRDYSYKIISRDIKEKFSDYKEILLCYLNKYKKKMS